MPWITKKTQHYYSVEIGRLETKLIMEEARRERAELELERMRQDFNTVVSMLGNRAQARQTSPLERDPFAEIETNLDVFLSPAPDEFVDPEDFIAKLEEE